MVFIKENPTFHYLHCQIMTYPSKTLKGFYTTSDQCNIILNNSINKDQYNCNDNTMCIIMLHILQRKLLTIFLVK